MRLVSFCILTALALLYAGLTLAETKMYQKWERALNDQKIIQTKIAFYQHLNGQIQTLLREMALASKQDPAMAALLKENKINVVYSAPVSVKGNQSPEASPVAVPDNTPAASGGNQPQANPTHTHP